MSATLLKTASTTAIAILSVSTIAAAPAVTPLPGTHQMLTVKLTEFDGSDIFLIENTQNAQLYNNMVQISNNFMANQVLAQQLQQQQSTVPDYLLANGYYGPSDDGLYYNPTNHFIVDPATAQVFYYDTESGWVIEPSTGNVIGYVGPEAGPISDPSTGEVSPTYDGSNLDPGYDVSNPFGSLTDMLANPFGYLAMLVNQMITWVSQLLGGLFGGFAASAVDPLDVLTVGAAAADSSLVSDLLNDALSGNPVGAVGDLNAAFADIMPAF